MSDLPYLIAAMVTLFVTGVVWKRKGPVLGIAAGVAVFVAVVLVMVGLGFGY